jgi:hypothetical protein
VWKFPALLLFASALQADVIQVGLHEVDLVMTLNEQIGNVSGTVTADLIFQFPFIEVDLVLPQHTSCHVGSYCVKDLTAVFDVPPFQSVGYDLTDSYIGADLFGTTDKQFYLSPGVYQVTLSVSDNFFANDYILNPLGSATFTAKIFDDTGSVSIAPEPGTWMLLALGLIACIWRAGAISALRLLRPIRRTASSR